MTWLIEILKIFKDLIASDKVLCNKAFNIAKNLKHDMFLLQWFQNFLMKCGGGAIACADKSATRSAFTVNQHLSVELHKPINEKIEKPKVYSSYRDNV